MKKGMIVFVFVVANWSACPAQTNFYTNVTNLWYQGHKSNVLAIANSRLAQNTNDIAGLILKAEYHFAFLEDDAVSNAYLRVVQVGDTITTPNFVQDWQIGKAREDIIDLLDVIAEIRLTPQQIQIEKQKAFINEKPLPNGSLIEALQKDGYFQ